MWGTLMYSIFHTSRLSIVRISPNTNKHESGLCNETSDLRIASNSQVESQRPLYGFVDYMALKANDKLLKKFGKYGHRVVLSNYAMTPTQS